MYEVKVLIDSDAEPISCFYDDLPSVGQLVPLPSGATAKVVARALDTESWVGVSHILHVRTQQAPSLQ